MVIFHKSAAEVPDRRSATLLLERRASSRMHKDTPTLWIYASCFPEIGTDFRADALGFNDDRSREDEVGSLYLQRNQDCQQIWTQM